MVPIWWHWMLVKQAKIPSCAAFVKEHSQHNGILTVLRNAPIGLSSKGKAHDENGKAKYVDQECKLKGAYEQNRKCIKFKNKNYSE